MPPNHLTLCHPLLLLPSVFPSMRVFSNESVLRIVQWVSLEILISSSSCNEVFEQHQNRDKIDLVEEEGKPNLVFRKYKYFKDERR